VNDSSTVEWLSTAIGQATKSAKFCRRLPAHGRSWPRSCWAGLHFDSAETNNGEGTHRVLSVRTVRKGNTEARQQEREKQPFGKMSFEEVELLGSGDAKDRMRKQEISERTDRNTTKSTVAIRDGVGRQKRTSTEKMEQFDGTRLSQ